ncbi:DUF2384 domain-containing protein [Pseudomonas sp. p1(2021b)]|uniref:type II RES/Xre toxin-antitoxin system antitoxin n=1 Tax=Pseudomonas sp. p1(2021b) TaxID=2874628 RepID=UPI001CCC1E84|nr:antitoxin Xre/MbcA/ParS toxin-binding domain-containing protein [Pseudomonas sp. p1(2021b)]UBM23552.1 DUF2384 domain-containing protein [Pseudomonas sp. p1(2021b)]
MIETTKKAPARRARYATIEGGRKAALEVREADGVFWGYSQAHDQLTEAQRLVQIRDGLPAKLYQEVKRLFSLPEKQLAALFNASISTLERRVRDNQPLDAVASERLDRIAEITHQAVAVFEGEAPAVAWMSRPNDALGGMAPVMLCETEIGAKQVRRALVALEWGGVV